MMQAVDERASWRDCMAMVFPFLRTERRLTSECRLVRGASVSARSSARAFSSSAHSRGGFAPLLLALMTVLMGLSWTQDASAYAWMIKHDYSACSTCHTDPSGGELLTKYGRVTSDLVLRTQYGSSDAEEGAESPEPDTGALWGALDLPDSLLLSGSYRNLYVLTPKEEDVFKFIPVMMADLYGQLRLGSATIGGSIGLGKVSEGSTHVRAAQVTSDQGDGINMISRTHYVGVDIGNTMVLRGGRLNLPFGVRIPEHTSWIREATRTDRESDQQHGLAFAYVGNNFRTEIMAIAGNYQTRLEPGGQYSDLTPDAIRERGYSLYMEGLGSTRFAAGITSKVTYAKLDRLTFERETVRQAHGLTMRYAPHTSFSVMAEADALFRSNANAGYVGFAQADYEPIQGLHILLTGEVLDQGMAVQGAGEAPAVAAPGLGEPRFGGWLSLDWFFYKQLEFRTDFILRQNESPTLLGQLHFYL